MESNPNIDFLKQYTQSGLSYLIQCTNIAEDELFKICLDFWHFFTMDNLQKTKQNLFNGSTPNGMNFNTGLMNSSFMHG